MPLATRWVILPGRLRVDQALALSCSPRRSESSRTRPPEAACRHARRRVLSPTWEPHRSEKAPHHSPFLAGADAAVANSFRLDHVIKASMSARIPIRFVGIAVALLQLRLRKSEMGYPFRMRGLSHTRYRLAGGV